MTVGRDSESGMNAPPSPSLIPRYGWPLVLSGFGIETLGVVAGFAASVNPDPTYWTLALALMGTGWILIFARRLIFPRGVVRSPENGPQRPAPAMKLRARKR